MNVEIKLLDKNAQIPSYATDGSAGFDLYAIFENEPFITLQPGETRMIHTGIAVYIKDKEYAGFIYPRSGLGTKGIVLGNLVGIIDSDYQGEIMVALWNRSNEPRKITHGDRIAQMVIQPIKRVNFKEVTEFEKTERGEGGFGSTGS